MQAEEGEEGDDQNRKQLCDGFFELMDRRLVQSPSQFWSSLNQCIQ